MDDTASEIPAHPDDALLFEIASEQQGYFTASQAERCGFSWALLSYHTKSGRFMRLRRGLYRLRDYPSSPREEVMAAWLAVGKVIAVVSHESALDLLNLSDVIPNAIHLTIPRARSNSAALPGTILHTTIHPPRADEIVMREGMRVTASLRTILDAAQAGTPPDQIERAVAEAIERGLVLPQQLRVAAVARGSRIAQQIAQSIERAQAVPR